LRNLADQSNAATIAMLDLCSAEQTAAVGVKDIAGQAGISEAAVRGQLAGLTMCLKNPVYGFAQTTWPVTVTWLPGGFASYRMDPGLAATWRAIRQNLGGMAEAFKEAGRPLSRPLALNTGG
jgi:hypothetical protein